MALEIFRLVGSVFVDTDKASKSLQTTDKKAQGFGKTLVNVAKKAGEFAIGVAGAATATGAAMVALSETTREYRNEQALLQTAFESSGFAAGDARSTYEALNSVLGDSGQAVEASNHLAKLCTNAEELSTWTNICTGVYATFGASLPIEGLTEAANETAKTGALTGSLADALNWAGVNEEAFQAKLDACNSEQERQALITETLNGLYSEASDHYKEVNADVIAANVAQDNLNQTMAKVGGAVEPIVTWGKELLTGVLEKAVPFIESLSAEVIPAATKAFEGMTNGLEDAVTWARENEAILILVGIAIGTLTTALIAYNIAQNAATIATKISTTATAVATAATTAWGAAVAFLTSPITLTVAAIGALIAIIYLLVTNWDTVKATAIKCWEYIKSTWSNVASWFSTNVIQPISNFFSGLWNGIKTTFKNVGSWFTNIFTGAVNGVKNAWSGIKTWFSNTLNGVKSVFRSIASAIGGVFKSPINTIIKGINSFISGLNKIKIPSWVPGVGGLGFNISKLPLLEEGAVLEKGQTGFLEGNGAEAVVPLHNNKKWISAVAQDMAQNGIGGNSAVSQELLEAFLLFVAELPSILAEAFGNTKLSVNNREFARLVKAVE